MKWKVYTFERKIGEGGSQNDLQPKNYCGIHDREKLTLFHSKNRGN